MSRYDNYSGSGTGSGDGDYNDKTLKLQKYAAVRLVPERLSFSSHQQYGDSIIPAFEDGAVLDGIVFQRDDKPDTWKVFGFGGLGFNVGEDGLVYKSYDEENDEFADQMSAQDVLEHARVQGFQESFGENTYWYTPVGVVIEESEDIAVNEDVIDEPDDLEIPLGEVSMLLGNSSWVRTLAKLITEQGTDIVATELNEDDEEVPVTDDHSWLTTDEPDLREELEGREIELFIIEETTEFDGEEVTYSTPVLLDAKTGGRITLDNNAEDSEEEAEADGEEGAKAVADGGATTADAGSETDTESPETTDSPDDDFEFSDAVDSLIDYFARTQDGDVTPDEFREFAEDDVDDPDAVDWEAAVEEAGQRA